MSKIKQITVTVSAIVLAFVCVVAIFWLSDEFNIFNKAKMVEQPTNWVDTKPVKVSKVKYTGVPYEESKANKSGDTLDGLTLEGDVPKPKEDTPFEDTTKEGKTLYTPGVDWSSGEISQSAYTTLIDISSRLVEQEIVESEYDQHPAVTMRVPTDEEYKKFKQPVAYYVDKNGILTLNLHVHIDYNDRQKSKEALVPVRLKYETNNVVLDNWRL